MGTTPRRPAHINVENNAAPNVITGAEPNAAELAEFGADISARISRLQKTIVGPGKVSSQKIIVGLSE